MSNRSRPLRVGVVGCGGFGRNAYVNNVVENPDASLVALCDVDLHRRKRRRVKPLMIEV